MVVVLTVGCGSARACPAGQPRKRRAGPPGPVRPRTTAGTRAAASRPCRRCVTGVTYCPEHGGAAAQDGPGGWRVLRRPALARRHLVGVGLLPAHGQPGDTGRRGDRRRRGGGPALGAGLAARRVAGGRVDDGPPRATSNCGFLSCARAKVTAGTDYYLA